MFDNDAMDEIVKASPAVITARRSTEAAIDRDSEQEIAAKTAFLNYHIQDSSYRMIEVSAADISWNGDGHKHDVGGRRWLDQLTMHVQAALGKATHPQYAFYPFSGYDLATVVAAFPDASVYVLMDVLPFVDGQCEPFRNMPGVASTSVEHVTSPGEVLRKSIGIGTATPLLVRMKSLYPHFHMISMRYFQRGGHFETIAGRNICHGVMDFLLEEEDDPRRLIYFNAEVSPYDIPPFDLLRFIDGVIVRGAADMTLDGYSNFKAGLESVLSMNGGVTVEGYLSVRSKWELWGYEYQTPPATKSWINRSFSLSTFNGLRVLTFKK